MFEESVAVVFVVGVCEWVKKKKHNNRCDCVVWMKKYDSRQDAGLYL